MCMPWTTRALELWGLLRPQVEREAPLFHADRSRTGDHVALARWTQATTMSTAL